MKKHEDVLMWNTINEVVPDVSEEKKEEIYSILEGGWWRIADIERLAELSCRIIRENKAMKTLVDVLRIKEEQLERRIKSLEVETEEAPDDESMFKVYDYGFSNGNKSGLEEALAIVRSTLNYINSNK